MPVVKGGVWTNIEDEVLKAAISKYGSNQWARVSSLLPRKTPKQCKARWKEWLDPSLKKIEWSKEEDEKLLHFAKLMPTQWRTLSQLMNGRTAAQCLERYQKLLDEAEQREAGALGLTGGEDETQAPTAEDVRKLRPGEIDVDPETRPARPDTIDLDEDEKELLSEARARLANTQGKKAKRKARERQQEESRRLAALQKRRELKASGINIKVTTRKPGQMDYNADIPFEKKALPGFYDTSDEIQKNEYQRQQFDPKKQQLGVKRKGEGDDAANSKRPKKDKQPASVQAAMKAGQMQKIREAEMSSRRKALVLPSPQVGERELEEIVKMGMIGERASTAARASENESTRGLVGNYGTLNSTANIRTPMAAPQEDHIANEIRNIRALRDTESSLLGGENTPLREGSGSTGFESAAPRKQVVATPNPLATPLRSGVNEFVTPAHPGQTPSRTPLRTPRDNFSLNALDSISNSGATPRDVKLQQMARLQQLKSKLDSLPKPKNTDWEFEIPEEQEEAKVAQELEEDAAERDRRERAYREAQEILDRKRRTQVMQRGLPRPAIVNLEALLQEACRVSNTAERMVAEEAAQLIKIDSLKYPLSGLKPDISLQLQTIEDDALAEARLQILMESKNKPKSEELQAFGEKCDSNALLPGLGYYTDDEAEQIAVMRECLEHLNSVVSTSADRGKKLEQKLRKHLGGYQQRAEMLRKNTVEAAEELGMYRDVLAVYSSVEISEVETETTRLAKLRDEVSFVSMREREAQEAYRMAREELRELKAELEARHRSVG